MTICYKDVHYNSYKQLTDAININYKAFMDRKYHRPERGIEYWIHGKAMLRAEIKYNGVKYNTYMELCEKLCINYTNFKHRVKMNPELPLEVLVDEHEYKKVTGKLIHYKGVNYHSYKELCDVYGMNYKTFRTRKLRHPNKDINFWIQEGRLIDKDGTAVKNKPYYDGVMYKSKTDLAKKLGVDYYKLIAIYSTYTGDTLQSKIKELCDMVEKLEFKGRQYPSYKSFTNDMGYVYYKFMYIKDTKGNRHKTLEELDTIYRNKYKVKGV